MGKKSGIRETDEKRAGMRDQDPPFQTLFCFLLSMVRLYTNEWTDNLSVILFVAFFLSELNGKASTYQGGPGSPQENLKFSI